MYTMKQVCEMTDLPYETLKFYCNKDLVPELRRDKNNYRVFEERQVRWIKNLHCLKKCGMNIETIKRYLALCLEGKDSVPERMGMLAVQKEQLLKKAEEIQANLDYIAFKEQLYRDILDGKIPYKSDLIRTQEDEEAPLK